VHSVVSCTGRIIHRLSKVFEVWVELFLSLPILAMKWCLLKMEEVWEQYEPPSWGVRRIPAAK